MNAWDTDVRYLKGVGEKRAETLSKLGIYTLGDLVGHYPRTYEDRTVFVPISMAPEGESVCIRALVASEPKLTRIRRGMELVKFRAVDESGAVDITYFNQSYMRDNIKQGVGYIFYGKIARNGTKYTMSNPDFEPEEREGTKTGTIMPRYHLTSGLTNRNMINYMRSALDKCAGEAEDILPEAVQRKYSLARLDYCLKNIHFPEDFGALELARRRLIFEEFFLLACALGKMRETRKILSGTVIDRLGEERFYSTLPFSPTNAQKSAIAACLDDMASGRLMNRLVQGDVGSGKTLVAACAIWAVCAMGYQAAFMAPTEILARQHHKTLSDFLAPFGYQVELLLGSSTAREKREVKAKLLSGECDLVIGTHALITGDVEFLSLALVVTDEQHRFGVKQRAALSEKGKTPHTLVMSATPIPRTLALMIYGDLDVSIIDELPPGRQKVDTFTVDESYRTRLNGFIRKLVGEGRQVFVVCPMVDENEELPEELKSATEHAEELTKLFPDLTVGCIHGKMKTKDKDEIMRRVVEGAIDILVSTTVIEVGVDVPNAALMIVENADRFGLSQLHQLRGRVGRGSHKSYCILVSGKKTDEALQRLKAMCATNDGFKISEEDLRLRGPGDFFGSRQHGLPQMHIADLGGDVKLMQAAQQAAKDVLELDSSLSSPENSALRKRIDTLFERHSDTLN